MVLVVAEEMDIMVMVVPVVMVLLILAPVMAEVSQLRRVIQA